MNKNKPDIIILMADQLRFDCLSAAGHPTVKTPALDKLCEMGTRFDQCYTTCPLCMPARSTFATGLYSHNHGQWGNYQQLNPQLPTYMRALRENGYHTAHIGKSHLYEHKGEHMRDRIPFMQQLGFDDVLETTGPYATLHTRSILTDRWEQLGLLDTFCEDYAKRGKAGFFNAVWPSPIPDGECMDDFIGKTTLSYLQNSKTDQPLCAFIGFGGPHDPWDPSSKWAELYKDADVPEAIKTPGPDASLSEAAAAYQQSICLEDVPKEKVKAIRRLYYAKVSQVDHWVGQILNVLEKRGNLDNTFILFWSDHGERLCDRGHIHKSVFFDESARVPLIICRPDGAGAGNVSNALCSTVDMTATVCEAAGVDIVGLGTSLLPVMQGDPVQTNNSVFSEIYHHKGFRTTMIRTEDYKMVIDDAGNTLQLFEVKADRQEEKNLAGKGEYSGIETALKQQILQWRLTTENDCR